MMDLVIPMAGHGVRTASHWPQPKPFIEVGGHPLLAHALKSVCTLSFEQIVFVANQRHQSYIEQVWPRFLEKYLENRTTSIYFIESTVGQGHTVSAGISRSGISGNFLVIPCDTVFSSNFENEDFSGCEGALGVFENENANLSYAVVDSKGYVTKTAEKQPISNKASSGLYYFANAKLFNEALLSVTNLSESFIAPIYNYIIKFVGKVRALEHDWVTPLGTVDELNRAMGDSTFMEKIRNRFKD